MHRKRFITLMFLATITAVALTACSKQTANDGVEIFKAWTDSASPIVEQQVTEFNQTIGAEKGIVIELKNFGGDYAKTIEMAIASGQMPDLFSVKGSIIPLVEKDNLFALSDLPDMESFLIQYNGALSQFTHIVKGKTYRIPAKLTLTSFIYNKDLFKRAGIVDADGEAKPPETFDEMVEYAKLLTDVNKNVYGISLPMKWSGFWGTEFRGSLLSSLGRQEYDRANDAYDFSIYRKPLELLMQIKKDKSYFPGPEGLDNDSARAQFAAGRVAMKMGASWDVYVLNEQFPANCDWGVAPFPVLDKGGKRYNQHNYSESFFEVSSIVKNKNLSKIAEIIKWFNSDERIIQLYKKGEIIPWKKGISDNNTVDNPLTGWNEFIEISKIANKPMRGWVPLKLEGANYADVFNKIWAEDLTIAEGIEQLNDTYNSAYKKGIKNGDFVLDDYLAIPMEEFDIELK